MLMGRRNKLLVFLLIVLLCFGCTDRAIKTVRVEVKESKENTIYIDITNESENIVYDWELSFKTDGKVRNVMNSTYEQKGSDVKATADVFTHMLKPHETYTTAISFEKISKAYDFKISGIEEAAAYKEIVLKNDLPYDKDMSLYEINEYRESYNFKALDEKTEYRTFEVRNSLNETFNEGKCERIDKVYEIRTGLDIGFNEIKLYGENEGRKVISIIKIANWEEANAEAAGFDMTKDSDNDGIPDYWEKRIKQELNSMN